jgi:hypothetical protein
LAPASIAPAHLLLHAGWNTGPPLLLLAEEKVQRRLEHLLVGRARLDVGLPRPGLLQLLDERPRDGEVDAAQRGGERFDGGPRRPGMGLAKFIRMSWRSHGIHRKRDLGDDRPSRHHRRWLDSTATALAACFEQWKNLGRTSARFCSFITSASCTTLVRHSRPSRSGSITSGNFATRRAATFR